MDTARAGNHSALADRSGREDGMGLRRNLGLMEAIGLSLSIIAPTMAMAFNVTLAAGAAGSAAPLAFAIGTVALAIVGFSFVMFTRRVANTGSAYAFITREFGPRAGFVAGWALMLTYLAYGTGCAAIMGNFVDAALSDYNVAIPNLWIGSGVTAILVAMVLAYRNMRLAARLMLALEAISVLAILVLCVMIIGRVRREGGLTPAPFVPDANFGWSGVGYAMVFAVLSFAGFEGAATLGEETGNPKRAIPIAVLGTVVLAGAFYVFASYCQVIGYGIGNMKALAEDSAPLNTLALKFASRQLATLLNVAAAVSAFACVLGCLSAASRMLFAMGRAGLAPVLGTANDQYGTPANAALTMGMLMIAGIILWAPHMGPADYYAALGTIGTLALILVYMAVTGGEAVNAGRERSPLRMTLGIAGMLLLLWPLYNSVYPVPDYPGNLWPYVVSASLVLGFALLFARPALARVELTQIN